MTSVEFVESIEGFSRLNYTEQVKRFCWHIAVQRQKTIFTGADVAACFDDIGCPKPSGVSAFLASLASRKPQFLIKRNRLFALTGHARDQLDSKIGEQDTTFAFDKLLKELPGKLFIEFEKVYLDEALTCFRHGAFRASIVMMWNLAYSHLCNVIMNDPQTLADFNRQLPKTYPKADISEISVRDHFKALKESQVLQIAKSANIISGNVHKILKEKLDPRNIAAHPSHVTISRLTAEDFILDLVQNVVLKV